MHLQNENTFRGATASRLKIGTGLAKALSL